MLALTAPAAAGDRVRVIHGDRSLDGLVIARTTAPQATGRLGAPSLHRADPPYSCILSWKALGLRLEFIDLDRRKPCTAGVLLSATVTGRRLWRTSLGLRVGDPAARVRALYPGAVLHSVDPGRAGYWLIVRHACAEVGGQAFPGLLARLRSGRVSALVLSASVCE